MRDNQEQDPTSEAPVSQYIYYILRFSNIQQAVAFSKTVSFPVDTSELYKMGSDYYLTVLIDTEDQPNQYPTWLLAIIREYADDSEVTRAVLQEHGHLKLLAYDVFFLAICSGADWNFYDCLGIDALGSLVLL